MSWNRSILLVLLNRFSRSPNGPVAYSKQNCVLDQENMTARPIIHSDKNSKNKLLVPGKKSMEMTQQCYDKL